MKGLIKDINERNIHTPTCKLFSPVINELTGILTSKHPPFLTYYEGVEEKMTKQITNKRRTNVLKCKRNRRTAKYI